MSRPPVKPPTPTVPTVARTIAPAALKIAGNSFDYISPTSTISSTPPQIRHDPRIVEGHGNAAYKASCARRRRVLFHRSSFFADPHIHARFTVNWEHCVFIENLNEFVTKEILEHLLAMRYPNFLAARVSPVRGKRLRFAKVAFSSDVTAVIDKMKGTTVAGCQLIATADPRGKRFATALSDFLHGTYLDPMIREQLRKAAAAKANADKAALESAEAEKARQQRAAIDNVAAANVPAGNTLNLNKAVASPARHRSSSLHSHTKRYVGESARRRRSTDRRSNYASRRFEHRDEERGFGGRRDSSLYERRDQGKESGRRECRYERDNYESRDFHRLERHQCSDRRRSPYYHRRSDCHSGRAHTGRRQEYRRNDDYHAHGDGRSRDQKRNSDHHADHRDQRKRDHKRSHSAEKAPANDSRSTRGPQPRQLGCVELQGENIRLLPVLPNYRYDQHDIRGHPECSRGRTPPHKIDQSPSVHSNVAPVQPQEKPQSIANLLPQPNVAAETLKPPQTHVPAIRFAMVAAHIEERDISAYVSRFGQSVDTLQSDPFWIVTFATFESRNRIFDLIGLDGTSIGSRRRVKKHSLAHHELVRLKKESHEKSLRLAAQAVIPPEDNGEPQFSNKPIPESNCANVYLDKYLNHDADDIIKGMQRIPRPSRKPINSGADDVHQDANGRNASTDQGAKSEKKSVPKRKRSRFSDIVPTPDVKMQKVDSKPPSNVPHEHHSSSSINSDTIKSTCPRQDVEAEDNQQSLQGDYPLSLTKDTGKHELAIANASTADIVRKKDASLCATPAKTDKHRDAVLKAPPTTEKDSIQAMIERDAALALALAREDMNTYAPATTRSRSRRDKPLPKPQVKVDTAIVAAKEKAPKAKKKLSKKSKTNGSASEGKKKSDLGSVVCSGRVAKRDAAAGSRRKSSKSRSLKKKDTELAKSSAADAERKSESPVPEDVIQYEGTCARSRLFLSKRNNKADRVARMPDEKAQLQREKKTARSRRHQMRTLRKGLGHNFCSGDFSLCSNVLETRKKQTYVRDSEIHRFGLFAGERIEKDQFIIEYVGESIRHEVADLREKKYIAEGIGSSYLFKLDAEWILDSTKKGSKARYVNHSCDPNTYAKVISVERQRRMCFYSLRAIERGEEITFNYKFQEDEEDEKKIPCLCRSFNCRKFMN